MATVPPPKRRRTGHKLCPIVEGSDSALDTAMYICSEGGERILVPVRSRVPAQPSTEPEPRPDPVPDPDLTHDVQHSADIKMNSDHHDTQQNN